jgi:hypothetical protein
MVDGVRYCEQFFLPSTFELTMSASVGTPSRDFWIRRRKVRRHFFAMTKSGRPKHAGTRI